MGVREVAAAVLALEPFRGALVGIGKRPWGAKILNRLNNPCGVFSSFDEAWEAARRYTNAGHSHPDAIKTHLNLAKTLRPSDYAALYWLSRVGGAGALRILDFGGNAGNLFYSYSPYLRTESRQVDWTVLDLPAVVEAGRTIAAERGAAGLKFTARAAGAGEVDVLLISGAFHYWERSVREFLEQFPRLPQHIVLNRTPVHPISPSFITVQRTATYAVPCVVRNTDEMVSAFAAMGYEVVDRWHALELSLRMPFFPGRSVAHYSGFYFRRQV